MENKEIDKDDYKKLIDECDSFIVICLEHEGNAVTYSGCNVTNKDIIAACEVVKAKIVNNCLDKS